MRAMNRATGYCVNASCEEHSRGMFLLNQEEYRCAKCHVVGQVEHEVGRVENDQPLFKEVRVEFLFDHERDRYSQTAIVRDESLWGHHNVYHFRSPMIHTEHRALKTAEAILATLSQMPKLPVGENLPDFYESHLNWDADLETCLEECHNWGESLKDTPLTRSE